jgi:anti-anti-sigma factor
MYGEESKTTLGRMTIPVLPDRDGDCTDNLRLALRNAPAGPLSIDLAGVPYLSSAALTELVRFRKTYAGDRIVLIHPNALVNRTLNIVGFNKLFAIEQPA